MKRFLSFLSVLTLALPFSPARAAETDKWAKEISAYQAHDAAQPPPKDGIFFVGSSSMVKWKTLTEDFPGLPVVNRGYGGSLLADMPQSADRLIIPYQPAIVVLYAGDNDLGAKHSVTEVVDTFKLYRAQLRAALPKLRIVFVAIKPSIQRRALMAKIKEANDQIASLCAADPLSTFLDVYTPMLDAAGEPRKELFVQDGLHMTPEGYRLWTKLLNPVLHQIYQK